jgi:hypothetical protein
MILAGDQNIQPPIVDESASPINQQIKVLKKFKPSPQTLIKIKTYFKDVYTGSPRG